MTHIFRPADRDELITLSRQLRAAYAAMPNPGQADVVINTDTSGPVQSLIVTDALYAAWEREYAPPVAAEPDPPPARVEPDAADEKPKRRRAAKKSTKTPDTRGA